jgi:hypothetical protein
MRSLKTVPATVAMEVAPRLEGCEPQEFQQAKVNPDSPIVLSSSDVLISCLLRDADDWPGAGIWPQLFTSVSTIGDIKRGLFIRQAKMLSLKRERLKNSVRPAIDR